MTSSPETTATEGRALLAVGTDSYESREFAALTEVRKALKAVTVTLKGLGFDLVSGSSGYRLNPSLKSLRNAVRKTAFAAPIVVVYYTGHGVHPDQDHYYLVSKKSRPSDYASTAIPASELLIQLTRRDDHGAVLQVQPHVLVILDCCYSGSAGMEILAEALHGIGNHQTWVIASAGTLEYAQQGLFAKALCEALERPSAGPSQRFISLDTLVQAINDTNAGRARQLARVFPPPSGSIGIPPFFPNKIFAAGLAGLTVDEQHWLSRVRAGPEQTTTGSYLTGKEGRLLGAERLARWITDPTSRGLAVVTGSPGTGKSALLALPVLLTENSARGNLLRSSRPGSLIQRTADLLPADMPLVAVHARGLNTDQVARLVAEALGREVDTAAALLEELDVSPADDGRVVLVDAADEAMSPTTLLGSLVLPLARQQGFRVVVGARRHVLPSRIKTDLAVDLDSREYQDPHALTDYIYRLLIAAEEPGVTTPYQATTGTGQKAQNRTMAAAAAIARRATSRDQGVESFLIGRLLALSARGRAEPIDVSGEGWLAELPIGVAEAFDRDLARLGDKQLLARALLIALAWAKGPGLPWENIWAPIAHAIAESADIPEKLAVSRDDILWLLSKAGAYIVEDVGPGGRSVYRPFHDLLAAHLRAEPGTGWSTNDPVATAAWRQRRARTEAAIARALIATVPIGADGRPDWLMAHPYLRSYLAQHAATAGVQMLSALIQDVDFLAAADPVTLSPLLSPAVLKLRDTARIYRRARPLLGDDVRANAAYLQEASRALASALPPHEGICIRPRYRTYLASVRKDESLVTFTDHSSPVESVAFGATADGLLLLASTDRDGTLRLWDPDLGTPLGEPFTAQDGPEGAVAFGATADGRLLLASAGHDGTVRLWDPIASAPASEPLIGHTGPVGSLAFGTTADGRLLLASAGHDGTVRLWDPAIGISIHNPFTSHNEGIYSVAFGTTADGRLLLAFAGGNGTVRLWDPIASAPASEPLIGHTGPVGSLAFGTTADGRLLLASAGYDGTVRLWDAVTGRSKGHSFTTNTEPVYSVAFGTTADGRLLLASADSDGQVRLRDPATGVPRRRPLSGHIGRVRSVAFAATADGRLLLASAGGDATVRLWDPTTATLPGSPLMNHADRVRSVALGARADGRLLLASAGGDATVRLWHPATGTPVSEPLVGHADRVRSVAFGTTADGRLLLASAGDDATVRLWDPATGTPVSEPLVGHVGRVSSVAFGTAADGRLLLASASYDRTVRLWDPVTGTPLREPLAGHVGPAYSVAFGMTADGRLVLASAGDDATVRLWDPVNGTRLGRPLTGHVGRVRSVAFGVTADGRLVLASAGDDATVRLWDPVNSTRLSDPLAGHTHEVSSVAFGPLVNGRMLLTSASLDRTIRLWDVASNVGLVVFRRRSRINSVAIMSQLVAIGDDEGVCVIEPQSEG